MLAKGDEIKGYRIERLLGRGGMGEVYEATQLELGRRVAFKVLRTGLVDDEGLRKRFRREGQLQATIEHPHVVTVYEAGEIDEGLFLAMRLVEGVTLKQLIVAEELDAGRALDILAPVAEALDVAHAKGLVHRDVKPQNILVAEDDHPFLADFGLTRGRDQTAFTRSGQIVGTIDYVSPEQVRGEPAGSASDIYALSGVLYECLTGSVPYVLPSDAAVLYAHLNDKPPSIRAVRDDLPAGLDAVVAQGMAKELEERPKSASELIAAATAEVGSGPAAATRPPPQSALAHGVRPAPGETTMAPGAAAETSEGATPTRKMPPGRARAPWLGVAGIAVLGALAFVGGRALGGEEAPELTTSVSGDAVSLRAPSGWSATSSSERPAVPGLRLRDAVGVAPTQRDASGAMAGMTDASGSRLLPAPLVSRVVGELPQPLPVTLGELEALRYRDVTLRGFDRDLTLYAAPSTASVATVACYSVAGAPNFEATCESIAQTLELVQGQPYPLATPTDVEQALSRAVTDLSGDREGGRQGLAKAKTGGEQAAAADRLADAYAAVARRLGRLEVGPVLAGQVATARSAISAAEADYRAMASSAQSGNAEGFEAAKRSVRASEARLDKALSSLERGRASSDAQ
ncbi:MAG: protein kinase [Solirubrobacterales bacterium]